ncbi:MAG: YicC family protein [Clostridiales Family XIII bacterium]|jgi:uncharacterized protein (TIGR00255 family)|nr:YicC family protein [Clostridiales Family XIII bacterium]
MVKSMTGFGRGEMSDGVRQAVVEIRAVNHRYGEIAVKLPRRYAFAEDAVKRAVRAGASRGKIDVTVNVMSTAEEDSAVYVNMAAAAQYYKGLRELEGSFDVKGGVTLELLANMPDVFRPAVGDIDEDAAVAVITAAVEAAVNDLNVMRSSEGEKLAADMVERAGVIEESALGIEGQSHDLTLVYADKLRVRAGELLEKSGVELPEDRIAVEVALLADKSDVTEEIVRLRSHLAQLRETLTDNTSEPIGKKLDFLVQEMNREANTIGSKANDIGVTRLMLGIKSEVEKIREQVQNVE